MQVARDTQVVRHGDTVMMHFRPCPKFTPTGESVDSRVVQIVQKIVILMVY